MVDNLPAATSGLTKDGSILYAQGIPIGGVEVDTKKVFLYNHVRMNVKYHLAEEYKGARIVGFEVHPIRCVAA
jgi:transmembrane 9 superfamily protein 2/4